MSLRIFSECAHAFGNSSAATIPVVAAAPAQTLALFRAVITANASTNVTFQDSAGVALSQTFPIGGLRQLILNTQSNGDPWLITVAGKGLGLAQSAAATIGFDVWTQASAYPLGAPGGGPAVPAQVLVPTAWNPSDVLAVTLSNNNLTAKASNSVANGVRTVAGNAGGKWYWECTLTTCTFTGTGAGLAPAATALNSLFNAPVGTTGLYQNGNIYINATNSASFGAALTSGTLIGVAVDLGAKLIWYRINNGNWNASAPANPATGTGGLNIASVTGTLFPFFSAQLLNEQGIANFGASAFGGAVPSGFVAGWGVFQ